MTLTKERRWGKVEIIRNTYRSMSYRYHYDANQLHGVRIVGIGRPYLMTNRGQTICTN